MSANGRVLQAGIQKGAKVRHGNASSIVLRSAEVALAAMCLIAGVSTLGTAPVTAPVANMLHAVGRGAPLVNIYNVVGVGLFLNYLTGAIEVASAIALLLSFAAPYAALVLIPTMVMTIADNVFILQVSVVVPVVLMVVATSVAWAARDQFRRAFRDMS
jgi:uncharacterized membrane protein YphA (DoxX/SURF4 family)